MNPILALLAVLVAPSQLALAVEPDDISGYYVPLKNANRPLNTHINMLLKKAAVSTKGCSAKDFRKTLKEAMRPNGLFARVFGGGVESYALSAKDIERYKPEMDTSLYANTPFSRAMIVNVGSILRINSVFSSIRLNGHIIGVDKLSHFFETGIELYEKFLTPEILAKKKYEEQVAALVEEAIALEEEHLGWTMTGIKSYGDIHAHTQGAFFWAEFFEERNGWWSCADGQITMAKEFDIGVHAQAGWSEAVQCNEYAPRSLETVLDRFMKPDPNTSFADEVQLNVTALEKKTGKRYQCPIEPKLCSVSMEFIARNLPRLNKSQLQKISSPECRK